MAGVQTVMGRLAATRRAMSRGVVIAAVAAGLSCLPSAALAARGKDAALIDRMTDQLIAMMPIDRILADAEIQRDMFDDSRLDKAQAACVLREMSPQRYRTIRRRDVELYAIRHPQRMAYDVELLESGAGGIMAKLMGEALAEEKARRDAKPEAVEARPSADEVAAVQDDAGADDDANEDSGAYPVVDAPPRPNPMDALLDTASATEVLAMLTFMGDPNYEELRALSGFGGPSGGGLFGSGFPLAGMAGMTRLQSFDAIGMTMMKMLLGAAAECRVPPRVLLDKSR
ncbi:MAG: hypothetical protein KF800_06390 [Lysobacter sp.]|nr:hypothetical protein [Lysobacter sp.]